MGAARKTLRQIRTRLRPAPKRCLNTIGDFIPREIYICYIPFIDFPILAPWGLRFSHNAKCDIGFLTITLFLGHFREIPLGFPCAQLGLFMTCVRYFSKPCSLGDIDLQTGTFYLLFRVSEEIDCLRAIYGLFWPSSEYVLYSDGFTNNVRVSCASPITPHFL